MSHTIFFPRNPDENKALLEWAAQRIPWMEAHSAMQAVGIVEGPDLSFPLLAVCFYHNYIPTKTIDGKLWYGVCEIGFAARSPKWATRRAISDLLRIPFVTYTCRKVVTVIPSTNKRAIRFNEGIGLKPEGTLRHHFAKGVHACIHGMMKSEFEARWKDPQPKARRSTGLRVNAQTTASSTASP
jgi:RimJ/RimL family protein N-acetyltransferase